MLSETQIMHHIHQLPPQSRLRLVQLILDTLIEPTTTLDDKPNRFHRLREIATPNPSNRKPFTIRQLSLGKEVVMDRDELYADRITI